MTSTTQTTIVAQLPVDLQQRILSVMKRDFVSVNKMINMNQLAAISDNKNTAVAYIDKFIYFFSSINGIWCEDASLKINDSVDKLSFIDETTVSAKTVKGYEYIFNRTRYGTVNSFMWLMEVIKNPQSKDTVATVE